MPISTSSSTVAVLTPIRRSLILARRPLDRAEDPGLQASEVTAEDVAVVGVNYDWPPPLRQ